MRKITGFSLLLISILLSITTVSGYTYTGTIRENGDGYWDDHEITFIDFELDEGETLELTLSASGNLELMLCDCDSFEDIQNYLEEMYYEDVVPDELYMWIDSYSYTSGSYTANDRIDVKAAIFSYDGYNPPSMTFSLTSNLPKGDRIDDGSGILPVVIIIGVIILGVYLWRRNKSSTPTWNSSQNSSTQFTRGYAPPVYESERQVENNPTQSKASFCPSCGSSVQSVFCTDCGTKVN